jgi:hypothetical protein
LRHICTRNFPTSTFRGELLRDEPPKVPEVPVEKIEPGPVRDYAAPGELEAAPDVVRLRQRDYRPLRGGSAWGM